MTQVLKTTILLSCLLLSGCFEEKWSGFYYPNKNNLLIDKDIGTYSTLEDCRQAASLLMKSNPNADYECGLNCDTSKEKPYICEKTER
jgi:hypothetical protein